MPLTIVGMMGPGAGASPAECQTAFELGRAIALSGWVLLTGGRNSGVMAAANQGAKSANGLTVGILPTGDHSDCSTAVDIAIVTGLGSARNTINVLSSQVVIACGMGAGTASEVALALKAQKPVILLHASAESANFFQQLDSDLIQIAATVAEAMAIVRQHLHK